MFEFGTIRYRAIEKEDLKYVHEWENDYDLFLYLRGGTPLHFITLEQIENEYNDLLKDKNRIRFIVENIGDNNVLGLANISMREGSVKSAEIGVSIGAKNQWNKGLGKLITLGLLEMLFYHRSFEKVSAGSTEFNKRAHKVLEYCGFKKEGELRRSGKLYGKYYSRYLFGIIYEDYMQSREKLLKDTLKDKYDQYSQMTNQLMLSL
jgi:RimJ/RimL family protein N-acetyltransferase